MTTDLDTVKEELARLLTDAGLEGAVPYASDEEVDFTRLIRLLPDEIAGGVNAAKAELRSYYMSIPPRRRAGGVRLHARHLLNTLLDRMELFEGLSRNLLRTCDGMGCPHFQKCPFGPLVEDLVQADAVPCYVEREVVKRAVEDFVERPDPSGSARIDPRRPEQALLFQELVALLVKKTRLSMRLQDEDVLVQHWEVLKDGDMEKFDAMNMVEHPLLTAWDRNANQIVRVMRELGISPEFQIRQGLYIDEGQQADAERRGRELAVHMLEDGMKRVLEGVPEDDPRRAQIKAFLENATKSLTT